MRRSCCCSTCSGAASLAPRMAATLQQAQRWRVSAQWRVGWLLQAQWESDAWRMQLEQSSCPQLMLQSHHRVPNFVHQPWPELQHRLNVAPAELPSRRCTGAGHAALLQQVAVPQLLSQLAAPPTGAAPSQQHAATSLSALAALARASPELLPAVLTSLRCITS